MAEPQEHHDINTCKSFRRFHDKVLVTLGSTRNPDSSHCVAAYEKLRKYFNVLGSHVRRLKMKRAAAESTKAREECGCSSEPKLMTITESVRRIRKRPETRSLTVKMKKKIRQQKLSKNKTTNAVEGFKKLTLCSKAKSRKTKHSKGQSENGLEMVWATSEDETEKCNSGSDDSNGTKSCGSSCQLRYKIQPSSKHKRIHPIQSDDDDDEDIGQHGDADGKNRPATTAASASAIMSVPPTEQETPMSMRSSGGENTNCLTISLGRTTQASISANNTSATATYNNVVVINAIPAIPQSRFMENVASLPLTTASSKPLVTTGETTETLALEKLIKVNRGTHADDIPNDCAHSDAGIEMEQDKNLQMMQPADSRATLSTGAATESCVFKSEPENHLRTADVFPEMTLNQHENEKSFTVDNEELWDEDETEHVSQKTPIEPEYKETPEAADGGIVSEKRIDDGCKEKAVVIETEQLQPDTAPPPETQVLFQNSFPSQAGEDPSPTMTLTNSFQSKENDYGTWRNSSHEDRSKRRSSFTSSSPNRVRTHCNENRNKDWRSNSHVGPSGRNANHGPRSWGSASGNYRSRHDGRYRPKESSYYNKASQNGRREGSFRVDNRCNNYHHSRNQSSSAGHQQRNYEISHRSPSVEHRSYPPRNAPSNDKHSSRWQGSNLGNRFGRSNSRSSDSRHPNNN